MSKIEAKVLSTKAYTWHTYNGEPRSITTKNGKHTINLDKGHIIGFRAANSDPSKMRMIHKKTGTTIVFTMSKNMATKLKNTSTMRASKSNSYMPEHNFRKGEMIHYKKSPSNTHVVKFLKHTTPGKAMVSFHSPLGHHDDKEVHLSRLMKVNRVAANELDTEENNNEINEGNNDMNIGNRVEAARVGSGYNSAEKSKARRKLSAKQLNHMMAVNNHLESKGYNGEPGKDFLNRDDARRMIYKVGNCTHVVSPHMLAETGGHKNSMYNIDSYLNHISGIAQAPDRSVLVKGPEEIANHFESHKNHGSSKLHASDFELVEAARAPSCAEGCSHKDMMRHHKGCCGMHSMKAKEATKMGEVHFHKKMHEFHRKMAERHKEHVGK